MWSVDDLGLAIWSDGQSHWHLDARGGAPGISLSGASQAASETKLASETCFRFAAVDQDRLPCAGDQFIRGDQYHVIYPQGTGIFELRMTYRPIQTGDRFLILEVVIAIQTDRLDTEPKIDLISPCESVQDDLLGHTAGAPGSAPITIASSPTWSVSVLLGPHDSPFTSNLSTASELRLRLFGDFLEKGVIRKARPWIVITQGDQTPPADRLQQWWHQLCDSPLPLTA
ncbi:MAG: hypothetical protein MI861_13140 [Pirellulales bacterium]|nr:hypothetical protein [Pirellulales bacterium]